MGYGDFCDYDWTIEFYSEDFPIARKEHRCCECGGKIKIGEGHLYARMGGQGEFYQARQHMVCRELCMTLNGKFTYQGSPPTEGCFGFEMLREEWSNNSGVKKDGTQYSRIVRRLMAQINRRLRREGLRRNVFRIYT